jgi:hypothetical protein
VPGKTPAIGDAHSELQEEKGSDEDKKIKPKPSNQEVMKASTLHFASSFIK